MSGALIPGRSYNTQGMTAQTWDAQGEMNGSGESQNKAGSTAFCIDLLIRL